MNPTNALVSPSRIFREAAKMSPFGTTTAAEETRCLLCAAPINVGDPCTPINSRGAGPKKGINMEAFNNKLDVGCPSSKMICGDCQPLRLKEYLQKYGKTYACADGVFKLASNVDQAQFLLNPPSPPYIAVLLGPSQKQQHLIWRAPINLDARIILVRMGDQVLRIDRASLADAFAAMTRVVNAMHASKIKGKHPFVSLDRELASGHGTVIRKDVIRLASADPLLKADVERLQALSIGELWGICILTFAEKSEFKGPVKVLG